MNGLAGTWALVTGARRGIGLAIAERLIAERAHVILADLASADDAAVGALLDRLGPLASYVPLDVTREDHWIALAQRLTAQSGHLDILVGNAGTDGVGAVEAITLDDWRRLMAVNVDGLFLGTKHMVPLLVAAGTRRRGGAAIINVSSIMGLVGYSETSAYNTSKGAARLFSKATAIEFAQKRMNIRVNSLHPGFVRTPLLDAGMQRWVDQGLAPSVADLIAGLDNATPVGRIAEPDEIAGAVAFLASEDASYITGAELAVDGGWTAQ